MLYDDYASFNAKEDIHLTALTIEETNDELVLAKAVLKTAKALGLTQEELGQILGRDRTSIARGLNPSSKAGELALYLIRCYRSLFVVVGGEAENIKHWFTTMNHHTNGVPKEQVKNIQGLVHILEYLDAIRGKI
ncbi:XRE family transcriptional regulator [Paremcibacter congregatus]|uniref:XRE family transcriptional regulator n=1 Tax=Paremcibacter congregatus TaxID=2043170 RepID=A0A2G4YNG9_9PROT|nr:XRE family transcriptional regulator [Paremcibacter congregatus]QDE27564.1 helix-turn-helix domain-containing protein [Paremcibacter congregatus]